MVDFDQVKEPIREWCPLMSEVSKDHLETHLANVRGVHLVPDQAEVLAVGLGEVEGGDGLDEGGGAVGENHIMAVPHEREECGSARR